MSYTNQDDGITYAGAKEHYHVSGYVTVKVYVSFDTDHEPDDACFNDDLNEAIDDSIYGWELEDDSDLEFEIERDQE